MARSGEQANPGRQGLLAPRANPELIGHEAAERDLRRLFESGRLPHALLLMGPRGIGKATLAFRLARFILARSGETGGSPSERDGSSLAVSPESSVFRRIAAGWHADLLTIERAYDARRKRLRSEIVIDDIREAVAFLRLTSAEDGWRIVIVDGGDEMNRNAGNALLKILEEPPRRALLVLVAHHPGRLLPTVRSRCRRVSLAPLSAAALRQLLRRYRPHIADAEIEELAALAIGSIGRALDLADAGGIELYRSIVALLAHRDPGALHVFADKLARPGAEEAYRVVEELLAQVLARIAVGAMRGDAPALQGGGPAKMEEVALGTLRRAADPARWASLREDIARDFLAADQLNLDRKQALLGAFFAIERMAG